MTACSHRTTIRGACLEPECSELNELDAQERIADLARQLAEAVSASDDAGQDRDALLNALGLKPGPLGTGLHREVILKDLAGLRPGMVRARRQVQDLQSSLDVWWAIEQENPREGLVKRLWDRAKEAERQRDEARRELEALRQGVRAIIEAHGRCTCSCFACGIRVDLLDILPEQKAGSDD